MYSGKKNCLYPYFLCFLIVQITNKCLLSISNLQHLEDLVLEGCFAIDDDSLAKLKQGCKSLQVSIGRKTVLTLCVLVYSFQSHGTGPFFNVAALKVSLSFTQYGVLQKHHTNISARKSLISSN